MSFVWAVLHYPTVFEGDSVNVVSIEVDHAVSGVCRSCFTPFSIDVNVSRSKYIVSSLSD